MHFSIDRTVHTTAFDKPVVDHWLERKIAQTAAGSTEKDRSDDRPLQRHIGVRFRETPTLQKTPPKNPKLTEQLWGCFALYSTHSTQCLRGQFVPLCYIVNCSGSVCWYTIQHSGYGMFDSILYKEGRKEMFYLTTHSTHFIYGYMASDIW